ncbi:putative Acid phosphatase [Helianthus annuus]|nr:putative Acid phosphatase [Helianthus annuus]KAJ0783981.1 putative Acid phosphatase [Helianthus annuus]KAJ0948926.1 putative Acid phosphatase [Helianthus annuus]
MGDLGQSYDSNITLSHYEMNPIKGQAVLFVGDISYADNYPNHDNKRWDSLGRFAERSIVYQPWIWTTGNHELHYAPKIVVIRDSRLRLLKRKIY